MSYPCIFVGVKLRDIYSEEFTTEIVTKYDENTDEPIKKEKHTVTKRMLGNIDITKCAWNSNKGYGNVNPYKLDSKLLSITMDLIIRRSNTYTLVGKTVYSEETSIDLQEIEEYIKITKLHLLKIGVDIEPKVYLIEEEDD